MRLSIPGDDADRGGSVVSGGLAFRERVEILDPDTIRSEGGERLRHIDLYLSFAGVNGLISMPFGWQKYPELAGEDRLPA